MPAEGLWRPVGTFTASDAQRLMRNAEIGPADACWPWLRALDRCGYGRISIGRGMTRAHRVSWVMSRGVIPPRRLQVMHRCDYPRCINPAHLRLGTASQNALDMIQKGRGRWQRLRQQQQATPLT